MSKLKAIAKDWRVILLLIFLLFSYITIKPQFFGTEGVTIRSVAPNSSASLGGIANSPEQATPLAKERILSVDGKKISSLDDFYATTKILDTNRTIRIETDQKFYTLQTTADVTGIVDLGLKVQEAPSSNLRKGLDLEGGTRVVLKPATAISKEELDTTVDSLKERLNVFGLSDVVVRSASDLGGDRFIVIEIAGVTEEEVKDLLAKQGKFEAKIGNETVFFGGKKDVTYVCRSAECSGIDPNAGCTKGGEGYICRFFFTITLNPEAAERQASISKNLPIVTENGQSFLSQDLTLFLDDKQVDTLRIGAELKGRASTNIQISGSGTAKGEQQAVSETLKNMKRLQTILITGSLPVKLDIVKIDTISPTLGKEFLNNIVLVWVLAVLAVVLVVVLRYRKIKIIVPMIAVLLSEMFLILGFAALVGWNLDLAAIAGIIVVAGTGVDHFVIITDEVLRGEKENRDWKAKVKLAMSIVFGAYLTTSSGMIPLWFAGAGLLKGFAFTTIAGISFGVLIARPAYAAIMKHLME